MLDRQDKEKYRENRGYNRSIKGCNRRCPCREWVNCPAYVDITEQRRRLKNKSDESFKIIHKWYDVNFRIRYEYPDSFGNG